MAIYGTALLSLCLLCGLIVGNLIGWSIGIEKNVGGVGIAMILLIVASDRLRTTGRLPQPTRDGILFWSAIYIPIVVAMAASLNVRDAIGGGPAAILAGTLAVAVSFMLVPLISRMGHPTNSSDSIGDGDRS
ncbi:MAG: malonate transporter subunit MadL [Planctomycetales bacterium]|nr:malonate transporter subunit MadL [Planctomycetales bacterium]